MANTYVALAQPIQPTPRRWYDRLADAVLGEEDGLGGGTGGASSKYALICKKCFTHNGLVMKRDFETTREFQRIFSTA